MPKEMMVVEPKVTGTPGKIITTTVKLQDLTKQESDFSLSFKKFKNLLRVSTIKKKLGFESEESEAEVKSKVYAVDAFLNGLEAYFEKRGNNKALEHYLTANVLFGKALEHADKIGVDRLDEIQRSGFKKYINKKRKEIKEMLRKESDEKLKEIAAEMALHGDAGPVEGGKRKWFRDMIQTKRTDAGMWYIAAGVIGTFALASWGLEKHYELAGPIWLQETTEAAKWLLVGWAGDRYAAARRIGATAKLWSKVFLQRYGVDPKSKLADNTSTENTSVADTTTNLPKV